MELPSIPMNRLEVELPGELNTARIVGARDGAKAETATGAA
jgi:hypothetical protein